MSGVLTDVTKDGKILYCCAIENYRTGFAGHVFFHAKDYGDAVNQLLQHTGFEKDTRIVGVAPAIGVHYTVNKKRDAVKDVIVR